MPQQQAQNNVQTVSITNFRGSLTRIIDGDMNSGLAKFTSSFGYDPFSKPNNLTWAYQPTDIKGTSITDSILAAKVWSFDSTSRFVYAIGNSGRLYKIDPTASGTTDVPLNDSPSLIGVVSSVSGDYNFGSSMDFFNGKIYTTTQNAIFTNDFSGGTLTNVGSVSGTLSHPMIQFAGKLYVGNGNNLMEIDATNTITNGAKLSPGLPTGSYIRDLDITPDGNYLIITASYLYPEQLNSPNSGDRGNPYAIDSALYYWNGTDVGITAENVLPSFPANALNTFLDKRYSFLNDAFGGALFEGNTKLLTLPQNLAPMPMGATPNGTFLTWAAPEATGAVNSSTQASATYTSLYYYGQLDSENQPGLWRLLRQTPSASNKTWRVPVNMMVNNFSFSTNLVAGWGKHYISVWEYNSGGSSSTYHFYRFVLPPAADTAPILGVYETQNQIFSKRVTVKQIRVYCEPTVSGNGFQLDMIGSDGSIISNQWNTNTYTFSAGTDPTKLQGALERIDFNPVMKDTYSLGLRITNTGTVNMTIHKVEIDWAQSGK